MDKKVVVFGASGKTGIQICEQLQEKSIPHFAFVRKGSENKIGTKNTELLWGDVLNPQDVETVIKEHHFTDVVITLGSKDLKNNQIRSTGTKNIVNALKKHSAQATVHVISALGVGNSWPQLNWISKLISKVLLKNTMNDHALQEEIITQYTQNFHIIRPVGLSDGQGTGKIWVQEQGKMPSYQVSRADVAQYLVDSLLSGKKGFSSVCKTGK